MDATNITKNNEKNAQANETDMQTSASITIQPFDSKMPEVWFLKTEAKLKLHGIYSDEDKFNILVKNIAPEILIHAMDAISNPPSSDKYDHLKKSLLEHYVALKRQEVIKLNATIDTIKQDNFKKPFMQLLCRMLSSYVVNVSKTSMTSDEMLDLCEIAKSMKVDDSCSLS